MHRDIAYAVGGSLFIALFALMGSACGPAPSASGAGAAESGWVRMGDGPERAFHTLVHDPGNDDFWLFGGLSGDVAGDELHNTVYERAAGDDDAPWFVAPIPGLRPPALAFHSATFDPVRRRMIVAGGLLDRRGTVLAEPIDGDSIWWLDLAERTSARWANRIVAGNGTERFGHAATYVPELDAMILSGGFSGFDTARADHVALLLGEDPMRWVRLPEEGFSPRGGHMVIWDAASARLLAFGGLGRFDSPDAFDEVLALDLSAGLDSTGPWRVVGTVGEAPAHRGRAFAAHAFDPRARRWWFHGGAGSGGGVLTDTVHLDLAVDPPTWSIGADAVEGPGARLGPGSAWDGLRRRFVAHGGSPDGAAVSRDTWSLAAPTEAPTEPASPTHEATPTPTAPPSSPTPSETPDGPSPTPPGGGATPSSTPSPSATRGTDVAPGGPDRIHLPWLGR